MPAVNARETKQFFAFAAPLRLLHDFRANHAQPVAIDFSALDSFLRYEVLHEVRVSLLLALASQVECLVDTHYRKRVNILLLFDHLLIQY